MQLLNRRCQFQNQHDTHIVIHHKVSDFVVACCPAQNSKECVGVRVAQCHVIMSTMHDDGTYGCQMRQCTSVIRTGDAMVPGG